MRDRTAARNLALAAGTLKASLKGKRKSAGWDGTAMTALIAGWSQAAHPGRTVARPARQLQTAAFGSSCCRARVAATYSRCSS